LEARLVPRDGNGCTNNCKPVIFLPLTGHLDILDDIKVYLASSENFLIWVAHMLLAIWGIVELDHGYGVQRLLTNTAHNTAMSK
jgi:hypothetical protein